MMQAVYDVVVVGAGGSGMAAALAAAEKGGRVAVLEKRPQPGGTTGIAVGSFTAAGTRLQRHAGIDDSPQLHADDAARFAAPDIERRNNESLRRYFLENAAKTLQWLEQLGLSFVGPSPEPPNRVPRMHNVVPGAKAYVAALQLALWRAGAELICSAEANELYQNEAGRVVGVRGSVDNQPAEFFARRAVVLAGGDYANNADLIARFKGEQYRGIEGINPHAMGEGHRLAESVGARLVNMDVTYGPELRFVPSSRKPFQQWLPVSGAAAALMGWLSPKLPDWVMKKLIKRLLVTWQHPEDALYEHGAVLVNASGRRFVDETRWPQREIAVADQPQKIAYILLDRELVSLYSAWPHFISTAPDIAYAYVDDYLNLRPDVSVRAGSLEQLAAARQLDPRELTTTVQQANQSAELRHPDPFGRVLPRPLAGSGWVLLGPLKSYFTTTEGGAAVNRQLQVLDEHDDVIPGLYAVGQNGLGGMILWGHGLHIAWAMTSGRLAGHNVMKEPLHELPATYGQK